MNEAATARTGETGALETWYRAHAQKLFCSVRRITRNHEDAEDAVQDAFLSAFLHLQSFEGRSTFSTWLTRIGINSALMTLRRKRKYREVSVEGGSENSMVPEEADSAPNPEQHYVQQERRRLVRKAIADLRMSIRRPVELHALQGHSMKEMAEEIGVSVSAAKGRLHHAKMALRKSNTFRSIKDRDRLLAIGVRHHLQKNVVRGMRGSSFKSMSITSETIRGLSRDSQGKN